MVRQMLILLLVLAFGVGAKDSGEYAHRAVQLLKQGLYQESYTQFGQALQASRKEADLQSESRIYIALAQLSTHAQDFQTAQEHLSKVRPAELNRASRTALLLTQIETHNGQGQFAQSIKLLSDFQSHEKLAKIADDQLGQIYCEAAWAQAALAKADQAQQLLDQAISLLNDQAPGLIAYTRARIADATSQNSAYELYQVSLEQSIAQKRYFVTGTILQRLGELALQQGQKSQAIDYWQRSAGVFEQLKLARPFQKVQEQLQSLQDQAD